MKPADRTRLTQQLRDHVGRIAEDLKKQLEAKGPAQERARAAVPRRSSSPSPPATRRPTDPTYSPNGEMRSGEVL